MSFGPFANLPGGAAGQSKSTTAAVSAVHSLVKVAVETAYPNRAVPQSGKFYALINIGRDRYLNLSGSNTSENSAVIGWDRKGRPPADNEKWLYTDRGGGKFTLQSLPTLSSVFKRGGFIFVKEGTKADGTKALMTFHGKEDAEWKFEGVGDKVYLLQAAGKEGNLTSNCDDPQARLELTNERNAQSSHWVFVEVVSPYTG